MELTTKEQELILSLRAQQANAYTESFILVHLIPVGDTHIQQNIMLKQKTLAVDPAISKVVNEVKKGLAMTQALFLVCNDGGFLRTFG